VLSGGPPLMGQYERTKAIRPAGVMATASMQSWPAATREAPGVIAEAINRQLVRVRPGRWG
jgi:hypothetical protein